MKNTFLPVLTAMAVTALAACSDKPELPAQPAVEAPVAHSPTAAIQASATLEAWQANADDTHLTELCAIDAVNGKTGAQDIMVPLNGPLTVIGWVSTENLHNPGDLKVVLKGPENFQIQGRTGVERRDVMDAYNSENLLNAGFQVDLASLEVPEGLYQIFLQHQTPSGGVSCDGRTRIEVTR
jgi:predicted small lipoprotein YifL